MKIGDPIEVSRKELNGIIVTQSWKLGFVTQVRDRVFYVKCRDGTEHCLHIWDKNTTWR